eukprot:8109728-Alexandrium_andersonii.AAC.2
MEGCNIPRPHMSSQPAWSATAVGYSTALPRPPDARSATPRLTAPGWTSAVPRRGNTCPQSGSRRWSSSAPGLVAARGVPHWPSAAIARLRALARRRGVAVFAARQVPRDPGREIEVRPGLAGLEEVTSCWRRAL